MPANLAKNRPPYRTPCTPDWTPHFYFPRRNHYRQSDSAFDHFQNITKIAHNECNPVQYRDPTPIQSCSIDLPLNSCATPCATGNNQFLPGGPCAGLMVRDNCYKQIKGKVNRAKCYKFGWKNVQAFKWWHGANGFLDRCPIDSGPGCAARPYTPNAPQSRYLTAIINGSDHELFSIGSPGRDQFESTRTYQKTVSVDRYSGRVSISACADTVRTIHRDLTDGSIIDDTTTSPSGMAGMTPGNCPAAVAAEHLDDGAGPATISGDPPFSFSGTLSTTVTENAYTYQFIADNRYFHSNPDGSHPNSGLLDPNPEGPGDVVDLLYSRTLTFTVSLSNPYTADNLQSDCETLLAVWDLTDDARYPWRTDGGVSSAPFVTRDEYGRQDPLQFLGNDCTWVDPSIAAGTNTGAIVGAPTPTGYDPFWDARHANYIFGAIDDSGDNGFSVASYGAFSPDWCPQATQWNDNYISTGLYGGAYTGISGFTGFPFVLQPSQIANPVIINVDGCFKQKWAETILFVKPSHNYARPCGPDRTAIDQTTIDCKKNPNGDLRWPAAPCNCDDPLHPGPAAPAPCPPPNPAALNQWNDNGQKGDFVTRVLTYNARDVGEYFRIAGLAATWGMSCGAPPTPPTEVRGGQGLVDIDCTQRCLPYANCTPVVICISPNGEVFQNGITLPLPRIELDWEYGAFWYCDVIQWMLDPLFQPPHSPDCDGTIWKQDNGSCQPCAEDDAGNTVCFYFPTFEEARCAIPMGAPDFPAGITPLGATNTAPGVWIGNMADEPQIGGGNYPNAHIFWENQLNAHCNDGDR